MRTEPGSYRSCWSAQATHKVVIGNVNFVERYASYVHFDEDVSDFIAEPIHLDGPDPVQVLGTMSGSGYGELRTPIMNAVNFLMEPNIVPLSAIITDGQTVHAGFLLGNLRRD
jgi:hypothetical protein